MADTTPVASSEPSTPPSSAADQARIRKERREAKIRAGGSARLNKISGLGGGVQRDPPPQPKVSEHDDPAEVDISNHYYEPSRSARLPSTPQGQPMNDDALRQMMLGFDPSGSQNQNPNANPFAGFPGMGGGMPGMGMGQDGEPGAEDPMMKMLQQMMSGEAGAGGMPSFPGMPGQASPQASDPYAYLWRIVHAIFALGLGFYIALTTPFSGSKIARETPAFSDSGLSTTSVHFFWLFATAEVLLQSSRFFLEKGKAQPAGILGMVMGFLPEPYKGYLGIGTRYMRIWTTISADAFVCVFVLGVCAWWRGA